MGSETILSSSLNIADDVLAAHKIDVVLSTKLGGHSFLLLTTINGNDFETHRLRVLASERPKSTSSADNCNCLTRSCSRLLQSLVDSNTGAENGCNGFEIALLGNTGNVCGLGDAVLLECSVDCVAGKEGLCAEGLVCLLAERALQAGTIDPLFCLSDSLFEDFEGEEKLP